ncbi:hypothetical protein [Streptomyces mirabilis]|uniref:hypothetical protein n=1 Tax=Streptomyces mirabilis TaxID=68239 RepID=UPI0036D252CF
MKRRIRKRAAVITASTLAAATAVSIGITTSAGAVPQKPPSKARIAALFDGWNAALKTGDPEKVADRYASDAVLLPTVSNRIRDTHAEIVDPVGARRRLRTGPDAPHHRPYSRLIRAMTSRTPNGLET